jgi:RNA polymerase sigma-70 factor, ECF subfamily
MLRVWFYDAGIKGDHMAITQTGTATASPRQAPDSNTSTDSKLIQRIAQGDQLAMRTLFARHHMRLYRFLLRRVRDSSMAEDLLSDVFLDVWRQAAEFEGRSSVSTWLLAIGRFKALSALRGRNDVPLDDEFAAAIPDPADNPEITLQKKNEGEVLRRCLSALSPTHGEIIDLVYYHEKSVAEVAAIVHVPEATVKTRMFYARKHLAELVTAAGSNARTSQ